MRYWGLTIVVSCDVQFHMLRCINNGFHNCAIVTYSIYLIKIYQIIIKWKHFYTKKEKSLTCKLHERKHRWRVMEKCSHIISAQMHNNVVMCGKSSKEYLFSYAYSMDPEEEAAPESFSSSIPRPINAHTRTHMHILDYG